MSTEITAVIPQNIEESERLAGTLAKSTLLPEALRGKPSDILATLLTGAELGLAPMQAVRSIAIIKGKPSLSADLMGALVKRRRDVCEYLQLVESSPAKATYKTKRVGEPEPTSMSFTIEDAKAAQLLSSGMYSKFPAAMLRARCLSAICRAVYPDLTMGLYDSDSGELTNGQATTEKDITPPPLGVDAVKRKMEIQDVTDAEVVSVAPKDSGPSPWEQIQIIGKENGLKTAALSKLVKSSTGKEKPSLLDGEDVEKFKAAIALSKLGASEVELHKLEPAPF